MTLSSHSVDTPEPQGSEAGAVLQVTCSALRVGEPISRPRGELMVPTPLSSFYTSMAASGFREAACGPRRPRRVLCWVKSPFSVFLKIRGYAKVPFSLSLNPLLFLPSLAAFVF